MIDNRAELIVDKKSEKKTKKKKNEQLTIFNKLCLERLTCSSPDVSAFHALFWHEIFECCAFSIRIYTTVTKYLQTLIEPRYFFVFSSSIFIGASPCVLLFNSQDLKFHNAPALHRALRCLLNEQNEKEVYSIRKETIQSEK